MSLDLLLAVMLTLGAAWYLVLSRRVLASRRGAGREPTGANFCLVSFWALGGAVELMATSYEMYAIGRTGHFIGSAMVPISTYLIFREYTGMKSPPRFVALLLVLPAISIMLAATNQYHEFMWMMPAAGAQSEALVRPEYWGPWLIYVHAPYGYTVLGAAMITLLVRFSSVAPAHSRGLLLLFVISAIPVSAIVIYDVLIGPSGLPLVPIVFTLIAPAYNWLIFRKRISQLAPLAYATVFQNMQDPVVVIDGRDRVIGLNHGAERMLDVEEKGALRVPLKEMFKENSTSIFAALHSGEPQKMMTSTGRFLHVKVSEIESKRGSVRGGRVLMFRDVSDVEKAQSEVRNSEKLLRTLIDHSANGIIRLRRLEGENVSQCIFASAAAGRFLNADPSELVDCDAEDILRMAAGGMEPEDAQATVDEALNAMAEGVSADFEVMQTFGSDIRWLRLICEPVGEDVAMTLIDVTDRKAKEHQMETIAWTDPLTGVLNRRGFERDASACLAQHGDDASGALFFIDLNDFKKVNDRNGHECGDRLLEIAARRLQQSLRSCDIIGRPGGDEFVALVPNVSAEVADRLATRLSRALGEPYVIDSERLNCAASIGLALYPDNAMTLTGLLREADQAMYRAKARCRGAAILRTADFLEKAI